MKLNKVLLVMLAVVLVGCNNAGSGSNANTNTQAKAQGSWKQVNDNGEVTRLVFTPSKAGSGVGIKSEVDASALSVCSMRTGGATPPTSEQLIFELPKELIAGTKYSPKLYVVCPNGAKFQNTWNANFVISSANPGDAVSIDANKVLHASKAGSAQVKASLESVDIKADVTVINSTPIDFSIVGTGSLYVVGETAQLKAVATFENGEVATLDSGITWHSGNSSIATIDANGKLSIKGVGTTEIVVTYKHNGEDISRSQQIIVSDQAITRIELSSTKPVDNGVIFVAPYYTDNLSFKADAVLADGSKVQLNNDDLVCSSSDEVIMQAIANEPCRFKLNYWGLADKVSNISAKFGNITSNLQQISINSSSVISSYTVFPSSISMVQGSGAKYTIKTDIKGKTRDITDDISLKSSNPQIVTIKADGSLYGVKAGSAQITGAVRKSTSGAIPEFNVVVTDQELNLPSFIPVGTNYEAQVLKINQSGSNEVETGVNWSSSNPGIAKIDAATGLVDGISVGEAVITAKVGNTSVSKTITVISNAPTDLEISNIPSIMPIGDQEQGRLNGTSHGYTVGIDNTKVTWKVIEEDKGNGIITVSPSGLVTAVGKGYTKVEAIYGGHEAQFELEITDAKATSLKLVEDQFEVVSILGGKKTLKGIVTYSDGSQSEVTSNKLTCISGTPSLVHVIDGCNLLVPAQEDGSAKSVDVDVSIIPDSSKPSEKLTTTAKVIMNNNAVSSLELVVINTNDAPFTTKYYTGDIGSDGNGIYQVIDFFDRETYYVQFENGNKKWLSLKKPLGVYYFSNGQVLTKQQVDEWFNGYSYPEVSGLDRFYTGTTRQYKIEAEINGKLVDVTKVIKLKSSNDDVLKVVGDKLEAQKSAGSVKLSTNYIKTGKGSIKIEKTIAILQEYLVSINAKLSDKPAGDLMPHKTYHLEVTCTTNLARNLTNDSCKEFGLKINGIQKDSKDGPKIIDGQPLNSMDVTYYRAGDYQIKVYQQGYALSVVNVKVGKLYNREYEIDNQNNLDAQIIGNIGIIDRGQTNYDIVNRDSEVVTKINDELEKEGRYGVVANISTAYGIGPGRVTTIGTRETVRPIPIVFAMGIADFELFHMPKSKYYICRGSKAWRSSRFAGELMLGEYKQALGANERKNDSKTRSLEIRCEELDVKVPVSRSAIIYEENKDSLGTFGAHCSAGLFKNECPFNP